MNFITTALENTEQMLADSDRVFNAISTGSYDNYKQAEQAVVMFYVMDMSFSRSGISHALSRLKRHFDEKAKQ